MALAHALDLLLIGIALITFHFLDELGVQCDILVQLWGFGVLLSSLPQDLLVRVHELQGHVEGTLHVVPVLPRGQLVGLYDGLEDEEDDDLDLIGPQYLPHQVHCQLKDVLSLPEIPVLDGLQQNHAQTVGQHRKLIVDLIEQSLYQFDGLLVCLLPGAECHYLLGQLLHGQGRQLLVLVEQIEHYLQWL